MENRWQLINYLKGNDRDSVTSEDIENILNMDSNEVKEAVIELAIEIANGRATYRKL